MALGGMIVKIEENEATDIMMVNSLLSTLDTSIAVTESKSLERPKSEEKKVKIKDEESILRLSDDSVNRRLEANDVRPIELAYNHDFLARTFSRVHISRIYGGAPQQAFVSVAAKRVRNRITQYLGLKKDWNPHLPQVPGAGGLVLSAKSLPPGVSAPLFICQDVNKWQYMGHYEMAGADPVSVDEWMGLPQETRDVWYDRKIEHLNSNEGQASRRRILHRKAESGGGQTISWEDIDEAIIHGDVVLKCSTIKCTSYSETIQATLINPPSASSKVPKKPTDSVRQRTSRAEATNTSNLTPRRARKRSEIAKDITEMDEEEWQLKQASSGSLSRARRTEVAKREFEASVSEDERNAQPRRKRARVPDVL